MRLYANILTSFHPAFALCGLGSTQMNAARFAIELFNSYIAFNQYRSASALKCAASSLSNSANQEALQRPVLSVPSESPGTPAAVEHPCSRRWLPPRSAALRHPALPYGTLGD